MVVMLPWPRDERWNWTRRHHRSAPAYPERLDECWLLNFETHLTPALLIKQKGVRLLNKLMAQPTAQEQH